MDIYNFFINHWAKLVISFILFVIFIALVFQKKIFDKYFVWAKKRKKILIIDDKEFPYFRELKKSHYLVERVKDLDAQKLDNILKGDYSVILLDIMGVGQKLACENEGFGLLRHIKEKRPEQCVLVFSDEKWNLKYQVDFYRADKVLAKTAGLLCFKEEIDKLIIKSDVRVIRIYVHMLDKVVSLWKKISS